MKKTVKCDVQVSTIVTVTMVITIVTKPLNNRLLHLHVNECLKVPNFEKGQFPNLDQMLTSNNLPFHHLVQEVDEI